MIVTDTTLPLAGNGERLPDISHADRRKFLTATATGLAAATCATGVAAMTVPAPSETTIVKFYRELFDLQPIYLKAQNKADNAGIEARKRHPEIPKYVRQRFPFTNPVMIDRDHIVRHYNVQASVFGEKYVSRSRQKALDAYASYEADCNAIDAAFDVARLENYAGDLADKYHGLADQIVAMPAAASVDLYCKCQVWAIYSAEIYGSIIGRDQKLHWEDAIAVAVFRDINSLAGSVSVPCLIDGAGS